VFPHVNIDDGDDENGDDGDSNNEDGEATPRSINLKTRRERREKR
jgi:hypothetical protein